MYAELIENRLVVWNIEDSRKLFSSGFFGKPIGIPKPKADEFDAPIILDLLEGYYLASKSEIQVFQDGKKVTSERLQKMCRDEVFQFREKLLVYTKLREAGFVVTPGVKFGADFAAYERGPGLDHAPYLVRVALPSNKMTATDIVLAGRLATTVRKQFIIAVADLAKCEVSFIGFDWWRA
ncbi:MAG TPA: tRNA-intron lyase [Nitrososphaerales archaeon]|nr:tRNA-intron lyase [Nitrososphaerales archaeon]